MGSFILEYSMRRKKINNEFGCFHRFESWSGQGGMGVIIKAFLLRVQHFGASLVAKFGDMTLVS